MSALITLLFAVGGAALSSGSLGDNSFLWHLRTGGLILDHGIPHRDPYSFTAAGTHWIAQSWLAELDVLGARTQRRRLRHPRRRRARGRMHRGVPVPHRVPHGRRPRARARDRDPGARGSVTVRSERPLWFGLALLARWCSRSRCRSRSSVAIRVVVPVVMWLWVNTHGTFALGFAYLVIYLVGRWLDGARPTRGGERELLIATAIAAAVIFVNPYGPSLVLFPLALMGRSSVLSNVSEWQSVDLHSPTGLFYAFWLFLSMVALARSKPRCGVRSC